MKKLIVYPYKMGSVSATLLAKALGTKKVYPDGNYKLKAEHIIINWGNTNIPNWFNSKLYNEKRILNHPEKVAIFADKIKTFRFTEELHKAEIYKHFLKGIEGVPPACLEEFNFPIYCRTKTKSHSGNGIVIANNIEEVVKAPLYIEGIKLHKEYRLHFFKYNNKIELFHIQQKRKMTTERLKEENIELNRLIRSRQNGWIYSIENIDPINETTLLETKILARIIPLNFFAMDININKEGFWHLIEVNTAPGLEGTTLNKYVEQFTRLLNETTN